MQKKITIATRESQLALWQANWVKNKLEQHDPTLSIELLRITTQADRSPYISLQEIGGKGLFVKELEEALLNEQADIAVHSMKDMPVELPAGLTLAAMSARESPWDVLVSNKYSSLSALPTGSVVGTSSLRRQSFLLHMRPDLQVAPLRGNVTTRLARLDSEEFAAIILAAAGLNRLGLTERVNSPLATQDFLPTAGQGVLGLECRNNDNDIIEMLKKLNDSNAYTCVSAERAVCKELGANCQVPVAAYAEIIDDQLVLWGMVGSVDGKEILRSHKKGALIAPQELGKEVGQDLLQQGAGRILQSIVNGRT